MEYVGYYNGEIGPLSEMKIPMLDRSIFFGELSLIHISA